MNGLARWLVLVSMLGAGRAAGAPPLVPVPVEGADGAEDRDASRPPREVPDLFFVALDGGAEAIQPRVLGDRRFHTEYAPTAVAVSSDGTRVAVGAPQSAVLFDGESGREVARLYGPDQSRSQRLAFSADGRFLFAGPAIEDGKLSPSWGRATVWEVGGRRLVASVPAERWAVDPDGARVAAIDRPDPAGSPRLRVWEARPWRAVRAYRVAADVTALALAPGRRELVLGTREGRIHFWNWGAERLERTLKEFRDAVAAVEFGPDGSALAALDAFPGWPEDPSHLLLWPAGRPALRPDRFRGGVFGLTFTPDGTEVVAPLEGARWGTGSGERIDTGLVDFLGPTCAGPDSLCLWRAGPRPHPIGLHDLRPTGFDPAALPAAKLPFALVPKTRGRLTQGTNGVRVVTDPSDVLGKVLMVQDGAGRPIGPPVHCSADCHDLSADGRRLVVTEARHAPGVYQSWNRVLDTATGRTLCRVESQSICTPRFDPAGRRFVVVHLDDVIRVWDAETGRRLHTLDPAGFDVSRLRWSADGRRVVSEQDEGRVALVWDLP